MFEVITDSDVERSVTDDRISNPIQEIAQQRIRYLRQQREQLVISILRDALGREPDIATDKDRIKLVHFRNANVTAVAVDGVNIGQFKESR